MHKNTEYVPIKKSIYSLMNESAEKNLEMPALRYFGKQITFGRLLYDIDVAASALTQMGIKKGDVVIVSLPSVPEAVVLFYAINKIGAIFCGMDCRTTKYEIKEIIAHVKAKVCFVSDFHLSQFEETNHIPVICVSFMKTIGLVAAFASVFVNVFTGRFMLMRKKSNFMSYKKFVSLAKKQISATQCDFDGDEVCAYFYTSGTTYGRKCVVLTNENINSSVLQYAYSQPDIDDTERFCTIMPLFTCYGITLGTHLPLILGKQVRMIPLFTGKNMKRLLLAEKPGYITTVPSHWEHFIKDNFDNVDLSFFKGAIIGGDKISDNAENKINEILTLCKSKGRVMRGYGLTEASTAVTCQVPKTPRGSVGTHMCWSEIGIFEPGTDVPVKAGEKGEICVCGPNICKGYLEDKSATDDLLHVHSDGKTWMHSGDIGYLNNNGFLFFCERIKRIFVRYDGTKMSPYAIEKQLEKCDVVSGCMVYSIDDPKHQFGKCPAALIVLKDNCEFDEAQRQVEEFVCSKMAEHMRPVKISYVDSLPITKSGKTDYFSNDLV